MIPSKMAPSDITASSGASVSLSVAMGGSLSSAEALPCLLPLKLYLDFVVLYEVWSYGEGLFGVLIERS
ncbi:uncharacterized protein OCT59_028570 [Rhizophagus irregularis]|uniref:uncharacterized protein n=1 Tax=Rhizophagus irregularis TaxID=588596 RepID=UPI003330736E|nr:hypothetical protein OCT59_028570 [Rhizophagus irregularis]